MGKGKKPFGERACNQGYRERSLLMSKRIPKSKLATVVIQEATGKRIRELCVTDDYGEADEFSVVVKFDDDTELVLNLTPRLKFAVHYSNWSNGRQEVLKRYPARFLRK